MAKKKNENTTSIGFEDAIWRAADKLRGNLNASEYEGVVLGLIFLKYISDKFEAKYQELLQEPDADIEDKDEYEADNVFFVPQEPCLRSCSIRLVFPYRCGSSRAGSSRRARCCLLMPAIWVQW